MTVQVITDISDASYNEMFGIMHGVAEKFAEAGLWNQSNNFSIAPITTVKELSVTHGAFLTRLLANSYLSPTVFFTNVSPLDKHPLNVIGKTKYKDIIFIGPNTGVFGWLVQDLDLEYLVEISVEKPYVVNGELIYLPGEAVPNNYSSRFENMTDRFTFDAHTLMGPVAVALAMGADYKLFGKERSKNFIVYPDIKNGEIVHIDNYGNLKIKGSLSHQVGTRLKILHGSLEKGEAKYICDRMMDHPTGSFALYPSTSLPDMTDLALVRGNAAMKLKVEIGDILSYEPIK